MTQAGARKVAHAAEAWAAADGVWNQVGAHGGACSVAWECSSFLSPWFVINLNSFSRRSSYAMRSTRDIALAESSLALIRRIRGLEVVTIARVSGLQWLRDACAPAPFVEELS